MIGGVYPGQTYPAGEPNVLVVTVSSATATASAPAPAVRFSLAAPAELATASGPAPTPRDQISSPAALATATAPAPTPQALVAETAAVASATGPAPTPQATIGVPAGLASGAAVAPTEGEVVAVPSALAIASMPVPTTSFVPDVVPVVDTGGGGDAGVGAGRRVLLRPPEPTVPSRPREPAPRELERAAEIARRAAQPPAPLKFTPAPQIPIPRFGLPQPAPIPAEPVEAGDTFPPEWAEEEELLLLGVL